MKITIEPTDNESYITCIVSCVGDDLTINEVFEKLVIPVLTGYGFAESTINEYLDI